MKTLTDYTQDAISKVLEDNGAFFAFSTEQFNEQKKPDIKYISTSSGLVVPEENATKVQEQMNEVYQAGIEQDIKENGIDAIIKRELINYEASYTGDIEDTFNALQGYNVTQEQVQKALNKLN